MHSVTSYTIAQNKQKLKPGLVAFYNLRPGKEADLC